MCARWSSTSSYRTSRPDRSPCTTPAALRIRRCWLTSGCVTPSAETAQDGSYTPLARPLFIYPSTNAVAENEAVNAFFDFVVVNDAEIAEAAGYIPLNDTQRAELESTWASISGS